MIMVMPLHADSVSRWIDGYLRTFAACVRGDGDMASLLGHFGVPMIVTSDEGVVTLMTDGEAAAVMQSQVDSLRALGFDHSEVLNSEVIGSPNCWRQRCIGQHCRAATAMAVRSTARRSHIW